MSWINDNAGAISALGSIVMNVSTVAIIFFNIHQFKLNRRSLNIEINFKLFELRKKLHVALSAVFAKLIENNNFSYLLGNNSEPESNSIFSNLKNTIENSEYLFARELYLKLQYLMRSIEEGITVELEITKIKDQNIHDWDENTTQRLKILSDKEIKLIEQILEFDLNEIAAYLNISAFHKDFISEPKSIAYQIGKFTKTLIEAKSKKSLSKVA